MFSMSSGNIPAVLPGLINMFPKKHLNMTRLIKSDFSLHILLPTFFWNLLGYFFSLPKTAGRRPPCEVTCGFAWQKDRLHDTWGEAKLEKHVRQGRSNMPAWTRACAKCAYEQMRNRLKVTNSLRSLYPSGLHSVDLKGVCFGLCISK